MVLPPFNVKVNNTDTLNVHIDNVADSLLGLSTLVLYDSSSVDVDSVLVNQGTSDWLVVFRRDSSFVVVATAGPNPVTSPEILKVLVAGKQPGITEITFSGVFWNEGIPEGVGSSTTSVVYSEMGDVTMNGSVSAFDAAAILRHAANAGEIDEALLFLGDVSGNGNVTAFDASLVLQFVADIIDCLPTECSE